MCRVVCYVQKEVCHYYVMTVWNYTTGSDRDGEKYSVQKDDEER